MHGIGILDRINKNSQDWGVAELSSLLTQQAWNPARGLDANAARRMGGICNFY
jgi:hypothetical protein